MRLLVYGGSGMLGHKLVQLAGQSFDAFATVRSRSAAFDALGLDDSVEVLEGVVADDFDSVVRAFAIAKPDVVVNCIGIVKQSETAKDPLRSIATNALFPHRLGDLCRAGGARLIHISTDCVFSGRKGAYAETDEPDPVDLYGRTKLLGEVTEPGTLTIRTSIIGRELAGAHGLIEWFLGQAGSTARGFRRAIFSGFTTIALSEILLAVARDHPALTGLWHVAASPISKFDLLSLVNDVYGLNVDLEPDDDFFCDRSLNATAFVAETGTAIPAWPDMIAAMYGDPTPYELLRGSTLARG